MEEINDEYIVRQREEGWPAIDAQHKALAFSYVQNTYDHKLAGKEVGLTPMKAKNIIALPLIQYYISEIANNREMCSIVTKHFITSQYLKLLPMVFGEVAVPMVLGNGLAITEKKLMASDTISVLREMGKLNGVTEDTGLANAKVFKVVLSNESD